MVNISVERELQHIMFGKYTRMYGSEDNSHHVGTLQFADIEQLVEQRIKQSREDTLLEVENLIKNSTDLNDLQSKLSNLQ